MPKSDPLARVAEAPAPAAAPRRKISGTRAAVRLEAVPPAPVANDPVEPAHDDPNPTKRFTAGALREMALRCASDVGAQRGRVSLPGLFEDEHPTGAKPEATAKVEAVHEGEVEARFFAPAPEPAPALEPALAPEPAPLPPERMQLFRREVLGEGYFKRRFAALLLLAALLLALAGDVAPVLHTF
jgi:hypothetical protein